MTRLRHSRFAAVAVVLAALLVGCSLVGIAYNSADRWLLHQADSYLELRDGQREPLRLALRQRLAEHRGRELADFVDFLDRVQRAAADGLDAGEVESLAARLEALVRTTVTGTLPPIAAVLATLEPGQIDHLQAKLEAGDRDFLEDYVQVSAPRRDAKRLKRILRSLEHWTGDLTAAQRGTVAALLGTWPDLARDWHAYRAARTAGLIALLRGRPDAAAVERYLAGRWVAQEGRDPPLQAATTLWRRAILDLILAVDASLTPQQRAAFVARVRAYRDDLAAVLPSRGPAVADARSAEAVTATP